MALSWQELDLIRLIHQWYASTLFPLDNTLEFTDHHPVTAPISIKHKT